MIPVCVEVQGLLGYKYTNMNTHNGPYIAGQDVTTYRQEDTVRRAPAIFLTRLLDGIAISNNA